MKSENKKSRISKYQKFQLIDRIRILIDNQPLLPVHDPALIGFLKRERLSYLLGQCEAVSSGSVSPALQTLSLLQELAQKLRIKIIVIQGTGLWGRIYAQPVERPVGDIDIYIDSEHRIQLCNELKKNGFHELHRGSHIFTSGSSHIDIHTDFIGVERIKSRRYACNLNHKEIVENSIAHPMFNSLYIPSDIDHFLLLTLHFQKHNFKKLNGLLDLALLAEKILREEKLIELLHAASVYLIEDNLAIPFLFLRYHLKIGKNNPLVFNYIKASLNKMNRIMKKAAIELLKLNAPEYINERITLSQIKNPFKKTLYLLEILFPQPSVIAEMYNLPYYLFIFGYALRIMEIIILSFKKIIRLFK